MRNVEEMKKVAETLQPIVVKGPRAVNGEERDISRHYFVGGNANADRLAGGKTHAKMAEEWLQTAARIELKTPSEYTPGGKLPIEVIVHNIGAGHNLPTGVTELRQVWVDLRISDQKDQTLFRSGNLDEKGEFAADTIWFGAVAVDKAGKMTLKPWEMVKLSQKRTIPPKDALKTPITPEMPKDLSGPITIAAKLLYRSASPSAVALAMPEKPLAPTIVEMAKTETKVAGKKN